MAEYEFWKVNLTKNQFDDFQKNDEFLALLTLARVVNSMRFCQFGYLKASEEKTAAGLRDKMASFLFICSILWEGLAIAETIGKYFREYGTYKSGLQKLIKDRNDNKALNAFLDKMRNQVAFHFDFNALKDQLTDIGLDEFTFVCGKGKPAGESYYKLADDAFLHMLGKKEDGTNITIDELEALIEEASAFTNRYTDSANELMAEVCASWGCEFEEDSNYA